jgi:oligopeptide transport system ATP-binding protein
MQPSDVVLEARDLVRHYPVARGVLLRRQAGAVKAVDGVSLTLRRGETLGIVGESGCGKSTLARLLLALERPTAGSLAICGEDVFSLRGAALRRLRRRIQIVLQDPYTALDPRLTVGEIVREPYEIHPDVVPKRERDAAVRRLLDAVGLSREHVHRYPHEFSGGQLQRIGIARALALRPEIVVCDEPVSALDVSIQAQVINLLQDLQAELGLSYVFVAHDLAVVRHVSDRVAVMYLGKVVETGSAQEIYERPAHPYTQALQSAVADPDPTSRGRRRQIVLAGEVPTPLDPPSGCSFRTRCWRARPLCADAVPALEVRPGSDHPCACHFASPLVEEAAYACADPGARA